MKRIGTLTAAQSRRAFTMLLFAFTAIGVIAGSVYGAAHPENGSFWLHQYFVPGRSCELRDVMIDSAGALVGMLLSLAAMAVLFRKEQK